ncbi:DNaJ domain (Prokaryotic heat shock protein) [Trichostrongylus colubriformis]|uniref:DNaJ domain (Prokaryotic heat shock protein) n=1 Tax=Trichostrongylus colubriformis TaxID=6319 RepID=A0AAN8ITS7_TRICO
MSNFEQFYNDIKATEKEDATLTSQQQLDRLLRPGSTYLNLNPFEVLQIEPDTDIETAKKKFKKLSLLIHPDKNPDDRDRADQAFDIIKKAMKQIENPLELNRCKDCYTEARARLAIVMSEKRRKAKKETGNSEIEEDDPEVYKKQLWINVTKVFADREKKRKMLEERANEEKRRAAETVQQAAEKRKLAEEFAKNYEESRDERSGSWRNFQAKKAKREEGGKTMRGAAFRPPKPKLQK